MSAAGSDCGIVDVSISTSGAEIGGAFGGEKNNQAEDASQDPIVAPLHATRDQPRQLLPRTCVGGMNFG